MDWMQCLGACHLKRHSWWEVGGGRHREKEGGREGRDGRDSSIGGTTKASWENDEDGLSPQSLISLSLSLSLPSSSSSSSSSSC